MFEAEPLDQALFGYSDGHRQLAASVRLSSRDQYQLAAATDLAAGSHLGPTDSYLTGLPLLESRRFALIRTWLAPEMPRPGCVWSHVILIGFRLLSSHGNLSDFLGLFRRPTDLGQRGSYEDQITLGPIDYVERSPDFDTVTQLIRTYYSNEPVFLRPNVRPDQLEASVMAVWSQQWPRLRASFSFRTALGSERRNRETIGYDIQIASSSHRDAQRLYIAKEYSDRWVVAAAADAVASEVSPLRRFLWRYGRDLHTPKDQFRLLVDAQLFAEDGHQLPLATAIRVFKAMPDASDGETLKRDILGIGSISRQLCPPLALIDLFELLAIHDPRPQPTEAEMRKRVEMISAEMLGPVATAFERHRSHLSKWEDVIVSGIVASTTNKTLLDNLPERLRALALLAHPSFVDQYNVDVLSKDQLLTLAAANHSEETTQALAYALVRRDLGLLSSDLFRGMPSAIFAAAIEATQVGQIHMTWEQVIASNWTTILETAWPVGTRNTTSLAKGLSLLRFPVADKWVPEIWVDTLNLANDDVVGEDRVRLQAYLLRVALRNTTAASWRLLSYVLPELRVVILSGSLPSDVYQTLSRELPNFYSASSWDINKRVLLCLSKLKRDFGDDYGVLAAAHLSDSEMRTVLQGEDRQGFKNPFWLWS